jgi:hypothetical protein
MARFLLFVVPSSFWEDRPRATPPTADELLREQLREAKALRERVQKGVNLEAERTRLTDVLGRIEAELLGRNADPRPAWEESALREELALGRFPALELDDGYLQLLAACEFARAAARTPGITTPADPHALGESIYREDQIGPHLGCLEKELAALSNLPAEAAKAAEARTAFYELVHGVCKHGVVELQVVQDNKGLTAPPPRPISRPVVSTEPPFSPDPEAARDRSRRKEMVNRMHLEVEAAVKQFRVDGLGGKVSASNQPHEVSTDVFGEWLKMQGPPARVRIVYADGSEAAPFPLCLGSRPKPTAPPRTIKAALMSMRHLDIDRVVDLAWYRNREVSQSRSLAESDEFCFRYSLAELEKLAALSADIGRPIRLEVYHTGFEPASVGLYRAVAAVLAKDDTFQAGWAKKHAEKNPDPWLVVVPHYFKGGTVYQPSASRNGSPLEWF